MAKKVEAGPACRTAPKGHFVVYVGSNMSRFVIPTSFLKKPPLLRLLDKSAEEYGFESRNKLLLPCEESYFEGLLTLMAES